MSKVKTSKTKRRIKQSRRKTGNSLLEQIGTKRDGLLIVISCTYVLGYIVWSLHAMVNHLGLLPAIDAQYFLAGVMPGLVLYLTYLFLTRSRSVSAVLLKLLRPRRVGIKRYTFIVVAFVPFALIVALFITYDWSRPFFSIQPIWTQNRITIILLWVTIPFLYLSLHTSRQFIKKKLLHKISAVYYGLFFSVYLIALYVFWIYPILPQELGGVKPRYAFVDIEATKLSDQARRAIFDPNNNSSGVLRSVKLSVLYTGNEYLLVKPASDPEVTIYELKREQLSAITWCN